MHVDMDAFYASVELRHRPELRGRPLVVGGERRGVVLSATYEARRLGVRSGMPSSRARRLAPEAVFVPPNFAAYAEVSRAIVEVFRSVTPRVESASIDEAFLDLAGAVRMFGPPVTIGEHIRAVVTDEQRITCSVGIGPTKLVAKMASRTAKPDGLCEVGAEDVLAFLHPQPVEAIWGIGEVTAGRLHRLGLRTVADLAHSPPALLRQGFGARAGRQLHDLAWGRDRQPAGRVRGDLSQFGEERERSVGAQATLSRDTDDPAVLRRELLRMADRTAARLRTAGLLGGTVTVGLRFADFSELSRSGQTAGPTDVSSEIYAAALRVSHQFRGRTAPIRRVGVRIEGLVERSRASRQPQLGDPERGWPEAEQAIDAAAKKFGPGAVQRAALSPDRAGARVPLRSENGFAPRVSQRTGEA